MYFNKGFSDELLNAVKDVMEAMKVEPSGEKFAVKDDESGRTYGVYDTKEEANQRLADEKLKMAAEKADEADEKVKAAKEKEDEVKEAVQYPHAMYNPKNGDEVVVRSKEEHEKYAEKGWVHEKPVNEVEEPRAQGEKEFKALHGVKKSGKNMDGSDIQEASQKELDENAYKEFFEKALKKFGVASPAELDTEKKKEFFDYVDKNWEGTNEAYNLKGPHYLVTKTENGKKLYFNTTFTGGTVKATFQPSAGWANVYDDKKQAEAVAKQAGGEVELYK